MTGKSCIPETLALPPAGFAETDTGDKAGNARGFHQGTRAGDGTSLRCRIYGRNSSFCRSAYSLLQRGADHIWERHPRRYSVPIALRTALSQGRKDSSSVMSGRLSIPHQIDHDDDYDNDNDRDNDDDACSGFVVDNHLLSV